MGLLYDLEIRLEQQIPAQLQRFLQQARDDYRPICSGCHLAMRRHHHQARTITTGYGVIGLQMPVFRGGERWQMTGGMARRGAAERNARYSKNPRTSRQTGGAGVELRSERPVVGRCQERFVPLAAAGAGAGAGVAAAGGTGNGRVRDQNRRWRHGIGGPLGVGKP